jgi:hypothetical protein
MKCNNSFQKLGISFLLLVATAFFTQMDCAGAPVQQQEQQPSQQLPPPSSTVPTSSQPAPDTAASIGPLPVKRRKVWTNDDVVVLRTPADDYLADKEAKQAAEKEAAAKEAAIRAALKFEKEQPLDIRLPATLEETEKTLKTSLGDIQEETTILDKLHKELLKAPTERQTEKQREIDRLTASIEMLRRNVKALEQHLQTLRAKTRGENAPVPAELQPPSI